MMKLCAFHHSVQAYILLDEILGRICDSSLKLLVGQYKHFQREVSFLANLVSEADIRTDLEKIRAVKEWPVPGNVHEMHLF